MRRAAEKLVSAKGSEIPHFAGAVTQQPTILRRRRNCLAAEAFKTALAAAAIAIEKIPRAPGRKHF
jgi:hypothetical protein